MGENRIFSCAMVMGKSFIYRVGMDCLCLNESQFANDPQTNKQKGEQLNWNVNVIK